MLRIKPGRIEVIYLVKDEPYRILIDDGPSTAERRK